MMISSTLFLAAIFIWIKHPMSMGLTIVLQTVSIALITGSLFMSFWFSYLLFIIVIGGLMILFIYMTTIASNEPIFLSLNLTLSMVPMTMAVLLLNSDQNLEKIASDPSQIMQSLVKFLMTINKYLDFPGNMVLLLMVIYLFITLIAVVKITNFKQGPLRIKS
uniref:NADH-ubiquinone oxidoreductase chain 6 n=1 Tax=Ptilodactylidae sp. 3 ACP-2013 TaxID=1434564 RepID=A0A3G3FX20_9COLE|nr:NADH dehydrogenase subunit 6 [Ptilodactylidae sp. 3 ACP-2013]